MHVNTCVSDFNYSTFATTTSLKTYQFTFDLCIVEMMIMI